VGGVTNYQDVWKYDPGTDSWSPVADYPGAVTLGISGFGLGSYGFVFDAGPGNPRAPISGSGSQGKLYRYTDTTNLWIEKASLPVPSQIVSASCIGLSGKGYVTITLPANTSSTLPKKDFWEYDSSGNSWTQRADVGTSLRWFAGSFTIGNKAYVGLGTGSTAGSTKLDFWQYIPGQ
jgi:N-acetylneuraminic acid mutarotase